jgi:signal transduction histidine kinase/integral membrane sensor domain MASE1/ActR/RegA family two-component response regulator
VSALHPSGRTWGRLPGPLRTVVISVALAAAYYAAARFGLRYASIGRSISLVWPPTGIALAALTVLGLRYWPSVAVGALLANLATPVPPLTAGLIACGNTLEALVVALLLRRAGGDGLRLDAARTVRTLVLAAVPLGAMVSAGFGVTALHLAGGLEHSVPAALSVWWTGDVLGGLVVGPLLLAWVVPRPTGAHARGMVEIALLCLGTVAVAELLLGTLVRVPVLQQVDYLYLLFPFVIWAALRFGPRGATLATFTVAAVAVWHTTRGGGPFIGTSAPATLFAAACYLAAVAVTGLTLAVAVSHERASAAAATELREEELRAALDAARMGTWSWTAVDDRVLWDATMRELYHLAPNESVGTYGDFMARVHPEDRDYTASTIGQAMDRGTRLDFEFRIVLPDGRIRWLANRGRVRLGPEGRVVGLTGVTSDVTDRRAAEEQLRQAHRMESIGRLAGGVAHEANNQMSVIIAATEFIRRHPGLPLEVTTDVEHIRRAADRTAAVTAQLLAFSRRQVLKPVVLDLNEVLQRFVPVLRRSMGEDCRVTLQLDPGLALVRADPGQLEQVVLNLALNARDAMPTGGELVVETAMVELGDGPPPEEAGMEMAPGRYAVLSVRDTGRGMDRATLANIFEPFFTTKDVGRGSGLGLSTVYGIVKQSGGYIWATSAPDRGSTFRIYLPQTAATPERSRVSASHPHPGVAPGQGELILVAEDEEQVRRVAARALTEAGYQVLEASNGREALEHAARTPARIRLVLTDVVMPEMSGRELAERLAILLPGTPVLFTSGYTDGEILRRGLLAPQSDFLGKPFSPEAVVRAVRERLAPIKV